MLFRSTGARFVRNPDPDRGQVSSQRLGLAALRGAHEAVVMALELGNAPPAGQGER